MYLSVKIFTFSFISLQTSYTSPNQISLSRILKNCWKNVITIWMNARKNNKFAFFLLFFLLLRENCTIDSMLRRSLFRNRDLMGRHTKAITKLHEVLVAWSYKERTTVQHVYARQLFCENYARALRCTAITSLHLRAAISREKKFDRAHV